MKKTTCHLLVKLMRHSLLSELTFFLFLKKKKKTEISLLHALYLMLMVNDSLAAGLYESPHFQIFPFLFFSSFHTHYYLPLTSY